ncbi:BED-type domain-containing protein, partial [Aphis craccivora]
MEQVIAAKTAKAVKKNVQSVKKQETLPFLHSNKISKQKIIDLTFAYIVEEMRPLVTCEKPAFKRLIIDLTFAYIVEKMRPLVTCEKQAFKRLVKGLCGLGDATFLPDRRVISKELNNKYISYITILTDLIAKQTFICTTADIWSCNNKSYLTCMTCHFIDEYTYVRYSYVLGCKRIKD